MHSNQAAEFFCRYPRSVGRCSGPAIPETLHQLLGIEAEALEEIRVLVGVDLVREFLLGWLVWSCSPPCSSMSRSLLMSICGSHARFGAPRDSRTVDSGGRA
jgi:hypothetical protein